MGFEVESAEAVRAEGAHVGEAGRAQGVERSPIAYAWQSLAQSARPPDARWSAPRVMAACGLDTRLRTPATPRAL
mgnify:CR=1 FL=1